MTQTTSTPDRIVVGVDGSAGSSDALRWAARLAPLLGRGIDVVTTWQYPVSFGYGFGGVMPNYRPDEDATNQQEITIKDVFGDARPKDLRALVVEGHPAQALLELSKQAEMLVVGSRGHGGFVGLMIGSVSAHCAEHATCPVVVIHHTEAATP